MASRKMQSGYCFEWTGQGSWRQRSDDEDWQTVIYTPNGEEQEVGITTIDGSTCHVWRCDDGKIRAHL